MHVYPLTQFVAPAQLTPPHCPHAGIAAGTSVGVVITLVEVGVGVEASAAFSGASHFWAILRSPAVLGWTPSFVSVEVSKPVF